MLSTTASINSQRNLIVKEDRLFWVADTGGGAGADEHGLYHGDTRLLSAYRWETPETPSLLQAFGPRPDTMELHYAQISGPDQILSLNRTVRALPTRLLEELVLQSFDPEPRTVELRFHCRPDFCDIFTVRGFPAGKQGAVSIVCSDDRTVLAHYESGNFRRGCGITAWTEGDTPQGLQESEVGNLAAAPVAVRLVRADAEEIVYSFKMELRRGEKAVLGVTVNVTEADSAGGSRATESTHGPTTVLPDYTEWEASFREEWLQAVRPEYRRALKTAVRDLRGLLISTADGAYPTAGIPWYVAVFGRDALLTSHFIIHWRPDLALAVLTHLARYQGRNNDPVTEEEPGKILHELRDGELAGRNLIPHHPYYGTVDATALYVMLCGALSERREYRRQVLELREVWEAALTWITQRGDSDGDGFVEYNSAPQDGAGTVTQSWKDSHDSMSHADGAIATGEIAGAEVQGYSYAAYHAAARLYALLGEARLAEQWTNKAEELQRAFDRSFWVPELGTYAMALDGKKHPLRVYSSNAGQLLWTGIVPEPRAATLVRSLFSDELWSGWGVRTLGNKERRYNPLSYHNGSVWPHDTAIIALGLERYGYHREAAVIRDALFELASREDDERLPELVGGYRRNDAPPIPYPVACRPQAWDAAALVALAREIPQ